MNNVENEILLKEFSEYLKKEKKLKENTVSGYMNDMKKFVSSFGKEVFSFCEDEILNYLDILKKRGKADSGISRYTGSLRAFYKFLYEKGITEKDISEKIKYNKTERKNPEVLTPKEIEDIFHAVTDEGFKGSRDRALLELMYATGLKASEILSLKRSEVNLKKNMISCTNGERTRKIPLYSDAADALREYIANYGHLLRGHKLLFINMSGGQITRQGLWKIIGGYAKKAGIKKDVSPSVLRNSFAVHLLENGADIKSVQEMLGHSTTVSTAVYKKTAQTKISRIYKIAHPKA